MQNHERKPRFTWYREASATLRDRYFENDPEDEDIDVVYDPRDLYIPPVPYLQLEHEPVAVLFTTDMHWPVWIVRYDPWRDEQAQGKRRDAAWLNRVVLYRFDLREIAYLVPLWARGWRDHWEVAMVCLRDCKTAHETLRDAAADALQRSLAPASGAI